MTETELQLCQLQQNIRHLTEISESGWVLKWGDSSENCFEVVCRKANAIQIQKLEMVLNQGYAQIANPGA